MFVRFQVTATATNVLRSNAGQAVQTRLVAPASAAVAKTVAKTSAIAKAAKETAGALRNRLDGAYDRVVEGVLDARGRVFDMSAIAETTVAFEHAAETYIKDNWRLPKPLLGGTNIHELSLIHI